MVIFKSSCLKQANALKSSFFVGLICLLGVVEISAQCPESLGCNDNIQISLDYRCFAEMTPDIILEDERDGCDYTVTLMTQNDIILDQSTVDMSGDINHPVIDGSYIGPLYKASVSFLDDNGTEISCWGWFTVEDKLPPSVTCIDDFTVDCSKDLSGLFDSEGLITYCSGVSPMDVDGNPGTLSLILSPLTGSGTSEQWEVINFLNVSDPLTGSGTGLILSSGDQYDFTEDPVDPSIYTGEIQGVQALDTNLGDEITLVIENTPANAAAIADGICVDINTISFFTFQQEDNCDPDVEVVINKDESTAIECIDDLTAQRDIEYFTRDNAGLTTDLCDFSIFFMKKELSDIIFPPNVYFNCSDPQIITDGQLDLSPENIGQPTLDGYPLAGENNLCKINVTFSDDTFNLCGINTIKILRRWTALDWCVGEYAQSYQTIKVEDDTAPSFDVPDNDIIFYTDHDCKAVVDFMPLDTADQTRITNLSDCSDLSNLTIEVYYLPGLESDPHNPVKEFIKAINIGNDKFRASGLISGFNTIKYVLTDDCGNSEEKTFRIIVEDDKKPIPVCDQFTVISLADNGWGRLYAAAVDDGSYDECGGPVQLAIKKDTTYCADLPESEGNDLEFGEYVQFCCQEAGLTIPVTLRVTDEGFRTNTCVISVVVQDKTGIQIESCPQDTINLDCNELDEMDPMISGMPIIDGVCGSSELRFEDSGSINDICGHGTIIRKWFVDLPGQTTELTECEQTFNITSDLVFNINSFNWPQDRNDATCSNYSSNLDDAVLYNGVPVNEANICGHLSSSYKDRIFEDVSGYCIKVIRTWTVINFCVYDANTNPGNGIWSRNQVIKVSSGDGPDLTNCEVDTTMGVSNITCDKLVNFDAPDAFDLCLNEPIDKSEISYEIVSNGVIIAQGFGDVVNQTLTAGVSTITWSATGLCDEVSTCSIDVTVIDNKAPTPYCRTGLTTVLAPPINPNDEPYLEIWANDFDLGTKDNCGSDVDISFDKDDETKTSLRFTCEDVGLQTLQVWFTDNQGNQDFCTTTLIIQDNGNICPDTSGMMVAGMVQTEFNEEVEQISVGLESMIDKSMKYDNTNINGQFVFHNNESYQDYQVSVISGDDYLNGVTTLDLVLMQRHILGLQPIESPYQIVASDVNNSEDITAIDLIELRKLILGVYDELPNNNSWRYIDKNQTYTDNHNPWPLKESIDIYDLESDVMGNDFVAVKIGDVNGSANLTSDDISVNTRSDESITMSHDILALNDLNEYLIPFYFESNQELMGMQLAMNFNHHAIEIIDIESGKMGIAENMTFIGDGQLAISWSKGKSIECNKDDALFYVTVKSTTKLNDDVFNLLSNGLNAEIYDQNLNVFNIDIRRKTQNYENKLFQNVPNPFSSVTTIEFELAHDSQASLTIYDTNGKVVKIINNNFRKGTNSVLLNNNDLNGNGLYYYQLDTEYFSSTRKMILIE